MNFEFSENLCGFQITDGGNLSRVKYQDQPVLLCQCIDSNDQVGIFRNIELPNQAQYQIKITGQSNNDRTYIKVTTRDGINLADDTVYFKKNEKETITMNFFSKVTTIRLSILMGGDSIVVRGNSFMIFQIRISPIINQSDKVSLSESSFKITRIFETVAQLELEKQDPLRSNQTPMEIGEYAILKHKNQEHNQEDLYILGNTGLKYVSRIGMGRPFNFGEPIHMAPGKEIPQYEDHNTAQQELNANPSNFYLPRNEYHYDSKFTSNPNPNDIYMYLDTRGYVRWLKYGQQII